MNSLSLGFVPDPCLVPSDYSSGFGGKYGVQADRVDKSAVGFDYQGKTEKHESQKGRPAAARPPRSGPPVSPRVPGLPRPQNRPRGGRLTFHARGLFT